MVSCTRTWSSKFLGLTPSGISHQQRTIVLHQKIFDLFLGCFIHKLLVVRHDCFRDGLSNSIYLCNLTTTLYADSDVDGCNSFLTNDEKWFLNLHSQCDRLDEVQRSAINFDQTLTTFRKGDGSCCFLSSEDLHRGWNVDHDFKFLYNQKIKSKKTSLSFVDPQGLNKKLKMCEISCRMYVCMYVQWDTVDLYPLLPPEIKEKRKSYRPLVQVHQTNSRGKM